MQARARRTFILTSAWLQKICWKFFCQGCRRHPKGARPWQKDFQQINKAGGVRINRIFTWANLSDFKIKKGRNPTQMDDFHNLTPGVEFTNSYSTRVNSTSDCHAHFSGLYCIISPKSRKCLYFQRKKPPPCGFYSYKVEVTLTKWN